jgi:SAM-dependent methyltransferase
VTRALPATGVGRVVRYNWPRYAAAGLAVGVGGLVSPLRPVALLALAWIGAGLLVTWLAYDRTALYRWHWLLPLLDTAPGRYAVVSTGLDEASAALHRLLPGSHATLLDLYDPAVTRTGSLRRARALTTTPAQSQPARYHAFGVPDAQFDAVFLVFAAHELRTTAQRTALHREIARTLRPHGRLILVEHCRDTANLLAYGPGALHFYSRRHWLRLARDAGLTPVGRARMTPLVHALAYRR